MIKKYFVPIKKLGLVMKDRDEIIKNAVYSAGIIAAMGTVLYLIDSVITNLI